ncbi:BCN_G0024600.mRNA.1.CDS.1 [Saccharomyces cerevisiae]|nr:BCN_G0024600.mRNA.1.CDS.1 [Saccharomyces cerevisiae]CAI4495225.1 BCE_3a_G0024480.mRNA.1.CDS.1 [Saccharomyces cerevisiae]CAI7131593.1 BCN_G0024600.mRNA.1.CDS.1 [Saccharomyces cerevisiae]CAI7132687.1 BCE_3a_G0024480.mRNA.1.CDS.1 [Saccharomyces cerevisiae]
MQFEERLQQLVESDWSLDQSSPNVLVIVLGDTARKYVELGGLKEHVTTNTVAGHVACRERVSVVFLGRVKYLYMYLTRMQAQANGPQYSNILVYGLWDLTATQEGPQQLRLLSLVLRQCLSLPSKVEFYPEPPSSSVPARLLRFWDHIIR